MKEKKSFILFILIILLICAGIWIAFLYNKTECNYNTKPCETTNEKKDEEDDDGILTSPEIARKELTYKNVEGHYVTDFSKTDSEIGYDMYFYKDGTFVANAVCDEESSSCVTNGGYIGNYIIENNELHLNHMFSFNGGEGVTYSDIESTMEIYYDDTAKLYGFTEWAVTLAKTDKTYNGDSFDDFLKNISDKY